MRRVYVTGMGVISSLGNGVSANFEKLDKGISGISKASIVNSKYRNEFYYGEIPLSNSSLLASTKIENKECRNRTDILAHIAIREAIDDAVLSRLEISDSKTGLISASTVEGICDLDKMYEDIFNDDNKSIELINSYDFGAHTLMMADDFGFSGFIDTINTACSSSANGILLASKLIQSNRLDRVVVGGVDSLSKFSINGFNSLRLLSDAPCKPFDKDRDGLNLGEGAAYLVLEAEHLCKRKKRYAEIKGGGNSNDAFHPSATSDNAIGPVKAMQDALKDSNLTPSDIDYINAHGTATVNNDLSESVAIKEVFKENIPPFISSKCYTGHVLGASGSMEALFSILSIEHQKLFSALNFSNPISETALSPFIGKSENKRIVNALSNSFGFGGNCTSLILSKVP